jgi:hypothetical protein
LSFLFRPDNDIGIFQHHERVLQSDAGARRAGRHSNHGLGSELLIGRRRRNASWRRRFGLDWRPDRCFQLRLTAGRDHVCRGGTGCCRRHSDADRHHRADVDAPTCDSDANCYTDSHRNRDPANADVHGHADGYAGAADSDSDADHDSDAEARSETDGDTQADCDTKTNRDLRPDTDTDTDAEEAPLKRETEDFSSRIV